MLWLFLPTVGHMMHAHCLPVLSLKWLINFTWVFHHTQHLSKLYTWDLVNKLMWPCMTTNICLLCHR